MNAIVVCNPYGEYEVWINVSPFKTIIYKHFCTFREAEIFAKKECQKQKQNEFYQ